MLLLDMEKRHQPEHSPRDTAPWETTCESSAGATRRSKRIGGPAPWAAFAEPTANAQSRDGRNALVENRGTQIQFENLDAARKETDRFLAAAGTGANGLRLRALIDRPTFWLPKAITPRRSMPSNRRTRW